MSQHFTTADPESAAGSENRYHRYTSNRIPWYVRLIWVGFWCFVVYYMITYLIPSVQVELFPN